MVTTPTIHLGAAAAVGPFSVFPVWTDAAVPRSAVRTRLPRGASITELPGGAVVDQLRLHNPTTVPFLLPTGTLFDGGSQHRVLVHSVFAGAGTTLDLDVRCVEQGRWDGRTRQRLYDRRAPLAVRGALAGIRRRGGRTDGARADQGDVWTRVGRYERTHGSSPSASLVAVSARLEAALDRVLAEVCVLPGQRGVLIGVGGHPVLLELFDHERVLEAQWKAILGGLIADASMVRPQPTSGHRARTFVARISNHPLEPIIGMGDLAERRDDLVAIEGLVADHGHLAHLTAINVRHDLVGAA